MLIYSQKNVDPYTPYTPPSEILYSQAFKGCMKGCIRGVGENSLYTPKRLPSLLVCFALCLSPKCSRINCESNIDNVLFIGAFCPFATCFSSSCGCGLYGLQLRAEEHAYGGRTARNGVTKKSTQQTGLLHVSFGGFRGLFLGKSTYAERVNR